MSVRGSQPEVFVISTLQRGRHDLTASCTGEDFLGLDALGVNGELSEEDECAAGEGCLEREEPSSSEDDVSVDDGRGCGEGRGGCSEEEEVQMHSSSGDLRQAEEEEPSDQEFVATRAPGHLDQRDSDREFSVIGLQASLHQEVSIGGVDEVHSSPAPNGMVSGSLDEIRADLSMAARDLQDGLRVSIRDELLAELTKNIREILGGQGDVGECGRDGAREGPSLRDQISALEDEVRRSSAMIETLMHVGVEEKRIVPAETPLRPTGGAMGGSGVAPTMGPYTGSRHGVDSIFSMSLSECSSERFGPSLTIASDVCKKDTFDLAVSQESTSDEAGRDRRLDSSARTCSDTTRDEQTMTQSSSAMHLSPLNSVPAPATHRPSGPSGGPTPRLCRATELGMHRFSSARCSSVGPTGLPTGHSIPLLPPATTRQRSPSPVHLSCIQLVSRPERELPQRRRSFAWQEALSPPKPCPKRGDRALSAGSIGPISAGPHGLNVDNSRQASLGSAVIAGVPNRHPSPAQRHVVANPCSNQGLRLSLHSLCTVSPRFNRRAKDVRIESQLIRGWKVK